MSQDDDVRILESDQDSSSEEDEESEGPHNNGRFDGIQSIELGPDSNEENYSDAISNRSLPKLGQGESTDSEDEDDVENDEEEEDSPLFRQPGNSKRINYKLHGKANSHFTSKAKGHTEPGFQNTLAERGKAFFKDKRQPAEESFLFRKKSIWDEENQLPKRKANRPRLFQNFTNISRTPANKVNTLSPRERALWKWANVENLDVFLQEVYEYYLGNGFYCICIEKGLNIATLLFVVFVSTYLGYCIDYSKLPNSNKFSEVYIGKCYSTQITGVTKLLLWMFYVFVGLKIVQLYFDIRALRDIHNFYTYLLDISDKELQTISLQSVIKQIMLLKDQNAVTANVVEVKAKNRIDAHDVANRIMRKENYLIALFNNDILDLSLPIPLYRTSTLTKTLEWNLNLCIMGFAFNESGYLKQAFLKQSQREYLSEELRKRFMLAGFLNIILSPFLVAYFVLLYFFRYFNEYKTTPGALSSRQYTPIAEWKFREYNELYHLFQKRIGLSVDIANEYIDQFPKEKTNLVLKFGAFVSGSFVAILAFLTIFDPENFLNFELTPERSVLFYISILGTVWAVCKSSLSDQYKVFDPEMTLKELISYTHYAPKEWEGRYHTEEVKHEFCKLYNLRIILLLRELASLVMTPFILWFSLPKSSGKIVDFFRDVSVYVDGLGYVCKYATFDMARERNFQYRPKNRARRSRKRNSAFHNEEEEDYSSSTSEGSDKSVNKMMQSYMYFLDSYQNKDNEVGKHQLPKNYANLDQEHLRRATNYSWKTQFQLGPRSESFQNKRVNTQSRRPSDFANEPRNDSKTKRVNNNDELKFQNEFDSNLGESFINSIPIDDYNGFGKFDERHGGNGVLGLLNQYYKKSDVGR